MRVRNTGKRGTHGPQDEMISLQLPQQLSMVTHLSKADDVISLQSPHREQEKTLNTLVASAG
jgi:hypothetical protein